MSNFSKKALDVLNTAADNLEAASKNVNVAITEMLLAYGKPVSKELQNVAGNAKDYDLARTKCMEEMYSLYGERFYNRGLYRAKTIDCAKFVKWLDVVLKYCHICNVAYEGRGLETVEITILEKLAKCWVKDGKKIGFKLQKKYADHFDKMVEDVLSGELNSGAAVQRRLDELDPSKAKTDAEKHAAEVKSARKAMGKAVDALTELGEAPAELLGPEAIADALANNPSWIGVIAEKLAADGQTDALQAIADVAAQFAEQNQELEAAAA